MDFAANVAGSGGATQSFANPITVGSKTGEGVNVISASDYNLTLTGRDLADRRRPYPRPL